MFDIVNLIHGLSLPRYCTASNYIESNYIESHYINYNKYTHNAIGRRSRSVGRLRALPTYNLFRHFDVRQLAVNMEYDNYGVSRVRTRTQMQGKGFVMVKFVLLKGEGDLRKGLEGVLYIKSKSISDSLPSMRLMAIIA